MHVLVVARGAERPEVNSLAESLSCGGKLEISLKPPPPVGGYQITWWELLSIYLISKPADAVLGRTYSALISYIIEQVRQWFQNTRRDHIRKRPLQVTIRNRLGRVLKAVTMSDEGERDVTSERRGALVPPPTEEDFAGRVETRREFDSRLSREKVRATVILCDIAGFSSLLGKQSMSVHRWMNACREQWESIVAEHGGKVIYSHHDNLAAYFVEQGDRHLCAESAVAAAVAIAAVPACSGHRRFAKVPVRVGVATGITSEYQLLSKRGNGPAARTAAALSIASRDSVLIDSETRRSLREGAFPLEFLGIKETVGDRRKHRIWRITTAVPTGAPNPVSKGRAERKSRL
jgi:hypothetical protein